MSITNDTGSFKIYDERNDFYYEIVNSPFCDGDVPRPPPSYGVYICSYFALQRYVEMLITSLTIGLFLTARLLKQGNRCHKVRKLFSKFYHRHTELIVKYNIGLKFFCNRSYRSDFIYKFEKISENLDVVLI